MGNRMNLVVDFKRTFDMKWKLRYFKTEVVKG